MAHAVVRSITDAVPGRVVTVVRLRVGVLSGAVPQALGFAWEHAAVGSPLEGSRLEIERVAVRVACPSCGEADLAEPLPLRCPACGSRDVTMVAGRELEIVNVDVEDPADDLAGVA